jgi:hypothetical protein
MTEIQSWLFPNASHLVANLLFLITISSFFAFLLYFVLSSFLSLCPLCQSEKKNINHNLINCQQTQIFRQKFVKKKWLQINKEMAF